VKGEEAFWCRLWRDCYHGPREGCRDNQDEVGFKAFKGKKLFGAVFGVIVTTDLGEAAQMEDVLAVGFENRPEAGRSFPPNMRSQFLQSGRECSRLISRISNRG
jgi:hypothetical protein